MAKFYDSIGNPVKGAWVVHHSQKTAATVHGAAEYPAIDAAGKAASLLSQFSASDDTTLNKSEVDALAKAAGINPRTELPTLLNMLERRRVVSTSNDGAIAVLGVTSRGTVQQAADIFEEQEPTAEERASIAIAEITSQSPIKIAEINEYVSDEFRLTKSQTSDFVQRSETIGFVDAEGRDSDKLIFNGNLFRRDNITKAAKVLDSLTAAEKSRAAAFDSRLVAHGCLQISEAENDLGHALFEKLRAAGMYDVHFVANPAGDHGFVTRPAAFHKFNDPLVDDAFDLAKALVAALAYGMKQSSAGRGKIEMIGALLRKLVAGYVVGPATAIGEDYRVLETKGVIRVTRAKPYGYTMKLLKKDVGEMALSVLTTGDAAASAAVERPLPGAMTGYAGPEKTRSVFRARQLAPSKKMTQDILEVLRTRGPL